MGILLVVLGILVLIFPEFLRVVVGVGLVIIGLYIALQNANAGGNNSI
ncbi:MAG: hypothetical protein QOH93_1621 [Chloroflexia bacterium]|jgi:hypothetical protein|nr:hypothetical protein [Chloroflexia bacterium]